MVNKDTDIKLLITGCNGFLGSQLINYFSSRQYDVVGTDLPDKTHHNKINYFPGNLTDNGFIKSLILKIKPVVVINTVALVNLDFCEAEEKKAYKVNVITAINLADALIDQNTHLVQISTDQLFRGDRAFYSEDDPADPINVYGMTKLLAEKECIKRHLNTSVIRTNIFGWSPREHNDTFAEWVFNSLTENKSINMFIDYHFTPIEVTLFVEALEHVIKNRGTGILNIVGTDRCSKYHFGFELAMTFGFNCKNIIPTKMKAQKFKAMRQNDLSLSIKKYITQFNFKLPSLSDSLIAFKNNMPQQ